MRLDKLPANPERSADELLAAAIVSFFSSDTAFPDNEAGFCILGHDAMPPTVYGLAWKLEPREIWLAHRVGTIYHGVNTNGEFFSAGAAAILVTDRHVRLMLGAGTYTKSSAIRGQPSVGTHLEKYVFRFVEFSSLGAGDLLVLEHWKLGKFYLKIPWARSFAALISGLRASVLQPKILENSVVQIKTQKSLAFTRVTPVLEVKGKKS